MKNTETPSLAEISIFHQISKNTKHVESEIYSGYIHRYQRRFVFYLSFYG